MEPGRSTGPGEYGSSIAIIGMAGRFPGARDIEEFWRNLRDGVESISFFAAEELESSGVPPEVHSRPDYVPAAGILDDIEQFDASYFGFSPREAEILDPQQRLFLECAVEALESAGYPAPGNGERFGVFGGSTPSDYMLRNLSTNPELLESVGDLAVRIANERDHLATKVAYKLNSTGPAFTVQTASSTSLVAVHLACRSLIERECDLALAGGVSIGVPQKRGHVYRQGGIDSPDGHCRVFDERADGKVRGSGVGIVVLKRLADAVLDRDPILALIRGSAINNDGSSKDAYPAPSIAGQSEVVARALAAAGVEPETVAYVEAHGTATRVGDPVEIAALTRAFRTSTSKVGFCRIGSVKSNVGHLDAAAGVTGLIKVVLALRNEALPPSLHFSRPNSRIDFDESPFYVGTRLADWKPAEIPRRAGVSSFGIGGTNAHVVVEEPPPTTQPSASREWQLLLVSARTPSSLQRATLRWAEHLETHPELSLPDVAYTSQVGRHPFRYREALVCRGVAKAARALRERAGRPLRAVPAEGRSRAVAFLFPGQGAQATRMGEGLYGTEKAFREKVDLCCDLLRSHLSRDLREILYPPVDREEEATALLQRTEFAQPALFVTEYALAGLWMKWGIRPEALLGHSIGEYVAACLAGVFRVEDALRLVAARGRLMQACAPGAMLAANLAEKELRELLPDPLTVAAVNGSSQCVASGPEDAIADFGRELAVRGIAAKRVRISHAFHSRSMDPILRRFEEEVERGSLSKPAIPFVSNVTGRWITPEQATDPRYWTKQLRETVRFADGLSELCAGNACILLEVGPGRTLTSIARANRISRGEHPCVASLGSSVGLLEAKKLLESVGEVWALGAEVGWREFWADERRNRVPLPPYAFDRKRYWVEARRPRSAYGAAPDLLQPVDTRRVDSTLPERPPAIAEPRGAAESANDSRTDLSSGYENARNETERKTLGIWEELLGIERIGVHDDFFELGGSSLFAIRLLARLRESFGIDLPLGQIFENPTPAGLAALVDSMTPAASPASIVPLRRVARAAPIPLSSAQQRLWFLDQLVPGGSSYNLGAAFRIAGGLDVAALSRAIDELVRRHESLRTRFPAVDGHPVQEIPEPSPGLLAKVDLRSGPNDSRGFARRFASEDLARPFDLATGPLFRPTLLRIANDDHVLVLSVHHIVSDGWSLSILFRELNALYTAFTRGERSPLPDLPIQYADYACWEKEAFGAGTLEPGLSYWKRKLHSAPPVLDLRGDRPRPPVQSFRGGSIAAVLRPDVVSDLAALGRRERATDFMTTLALFLVLLGWQTRQEDLVVGCPSAGRSRRETEDVIGLFVNTLVLRTRVARSLTFRELLGRVREMVLAADAHRDVPFERLVDELRPQRSMSHNPLFQVWFVLQDGTAEALSLGNLSVRSMGIEPAAVRHDLQLTIRTRSDRIEALFVYRADLFDADTVRRLASRFERLAVSVVSRPESSVDQLFAELDAEENSDRTQQQRDLDIELGRRLEISRRRRMHR